MVAFDVVCLVIGCDVLVVMFLLYLDLAVVVVLFGFCLIVLWLLFVF